MLRSMKSLAKRELRRYQHWRNKAVLKTNSRHVGKEELILALRALGVVPGKTVMLHSSLKSIGYVPGGAPDVIKALCEAISPGGTLVVPTYYQPGGSILATCRMDGYYFDPVRHGTGLGALPEAFLRVPGIERSIHPTHSVSAVGPNAKYVTEAHHTAPSIFGVGSPWQRCLELDALVLGLGVSMGPVTFYHLLEDSVGDNFPLPVRMREVYVLTCRDWKGNEIRVPVRPLDPEYARRRIDTPGRGDLRDYFWNEFSGAGLLRAGMVGEARSWSIQARRFYAHLETLMREGITIYSTPEELARRPISRS